MQRPHNHFLRTRGPDRTTNGRTGGRAVTAPSESHTDRIVRRTLWDGDVSLRIEARLANPIFHTAHYADDLAARSHGARLQYAEVRDVRAAPTNVEVTT